MAIALAFLICSPLLIPVFGLMFYFPSTGKAKQ